MIKTYGNGYILRAPSIPGQKHKNAAKQTSNTRPTFITQLLKEMKRTSEDDKLAVKTWLNCSDYSRHILFQYGVFSGFSYHWIGPLTYDYWNKKGTLAGEFQYLSVLVGLKTHKRWPRDVQQFISAVFVDLKTSKQVGETFFSHQSESPSVLNFKLSHSISSESHPLSMETYEYTKSTMAYHQNYVRNSRAIGVLWAIFSICFSIINILVFAYPNWIGNSPDSAEPGQFGLYQYSTLDRDGLSVSESTKGRLDNFDLILSSSFKVILSLKLPRFKFL